MALIYCNKKNSMWLSLIKQPWNFHLPYFKPFLVNVFLKRCFCFAFVFQFHFCFLYFFSFFFFCFCFSFLFLLPITSQVFSFKTMFLSSCPIDPFYVVKATGFQTKLSLIATHTILYLYLIYSLLSCLIYSYLQWCHHFFIKWRQR